MANEDSQSQLVDTEDSLFDSIKTPFPFSKVKGICKLDPDLDIINPDAVKLISKATEYFIEELSRACYTQAVLDKRKTVQTKDIDKVIQSNPFFEFLEDALDNWLEDVNEEETMEMGELEEGLETVRDGETTTGEEGESMADEATERNEEGESEGIEEAETAESPDTMGEEEETV